ncbi:hypothetical protein G6F57_022003 [Rhizopus arrhizus]|nr:hypothetical protein G6F57_022003 [Rhizopus arrhizus]
MKGADRPRGVVLEIVEMGCRLAVPDPFENIEVYLHRFLGLVEHAANDRRCGIPGKLLDLSIRQQVDIELRPYVGDEARQRDAGLGRRSTGEGAHVLMTTASILPFSIVASTASSKLPTSTGS